MSMKIFTKKDSEASESTEENTGDLVGLVPAGFGETQELPKIYPDPHKASLIFIPESVLNARRAAKTQKTALVVCASLVVATLAAGGVVWGMAAGSESTVAERESSISSMRTEATRLAPVDDYYNGFVSRQGAVSSALNRDVTYALISQNVEESLVEGQSVDTLSTAYGTVCPGPNPFETTPNVIGCVSLTLVGNDVLSAGVFADNLTAKPGMADTYVISATSSEAGSEFLITANFTANPTEQYPLGVLSGKYQQFTNANEGTGIPEEVVAGDSVVEEQPGEPVEEAPVEEQAPVDEAPAPVDGEIDNTQEGDN